MNRNLFGWLKRCAIGTAILTACSSGSALALQNNNDGTITDGKLVWLKDANCFGKHSWYDMVDRVRSLSSGSCGLSDKSSAGQWRLPTTTEMLDRYRDKTGFKSVKEYYWTSSELSSVPDKAYLMDVLRGYGAVYPKTEKYYVWPVRNK